MFYRGIIGKAFNEAVALNKTASSDLKQALRNHPAITSSLDKLAIDFEKIAEYRSTKGQPNIDTKHIKAIVSDMVELYCIKIEKEAELRAETDFKRLAREDKERKIRDLDASASGKLQGEYADFAEEAGLIQVDERDVL